MVLIIVGTNFQNLGFLYEKKKTIKDDQSLISLIQSMRWEFPIAEQTGNLNKFVVWLVESVIIYFLSLSPQRCFTFPHLLQFFWSKVT